MRRSHGGGTAEEHTLGVKDIHEVPERCGSRPDRRRSSPTSAFKPPRPGCWPRRIPLRPWPPGVARSCPFRSSRRPGIASMHGDPLLAPSALDSLRGQLSLATLLTPNLDEAVVDAVRPACGGQSLHALGPEWVLVKADTCARSDGSCCSL